MTRGPDADTYGFKLIPQNGIVLAEPESRLLEPGKTVDLGTFRLN
jgi:hypothetical protein